MFKELQIWIHGIERRFKAFIEANQCSPWEAAYAEAVHQAIIAAKHGNFGVGAVLCDHEGRIIARGHNEVFVPYVRSDAHAEMVTMNNFEKMQHHADKAIDPSTLTLITTLEPCIMCMGRLLISAVNQIRYMALDEGHGATDVVHHLRAPYQTFTSKTSYIHADDCPKELLEMAHEVCFSNPLIEQQKSNHGVALDVDPVS